MSKKIKSLVALPVLAFLAFSVLNIDTASAYNLTLRPAGASSQGGQAWNGVLTSTWKKSKSTLRSKFSEKVRNELSSDGWPVSSCGLYIEGSYHYDNCNSKGTKCREIEAKVGSNSSCRR